MPRLRPPSSPSLLRRPIFWLGLLVLAGLTLAAWINLPALTPVFDRSSARVAALPAAPPFRAGQRILVLSPHPDDETLCCAGMIQQANAAGAQVYIAWMTAGDGFEFDAALTERTLRPGAAAMRKLGNARVAETQRAAEVLGVQRDHTFMLGYPDGGLFRLFTTNYASAYTSPRTRANAVYVMGALTPGAPFTGQAFEADITRVLNRVKPDLVLAPAPQDFHSDHHTLSYIALQLMSRRAQADRLRYWVVHGGLEWPVPKGVHEGLALTEPPLANRLPWTRVDLSPEQRARKLEAVRAYHTQTAIEPRFMEAFVRANELLSSEPLPDTDLVSSPPERPNEQP